jgi:hypothetical protein
MIAMGDAYGWALRPPARDAASAAIDDTVPHSGARDRLRPAPPLAPSVAKESSAPATPARPRLHLVAA